MSTQGKQGLKDESISEEAVEQYLRAHPDFFERHMALLSVLKLPHTTGGAVSLIERQVGVLRDKNHQLERKLMDLVQVARDNEHLSSRLHQLALGLIEADGIDAVLATTQDVLRSEFKADHVVIRLLGDAQRAQSLHFVARDHPDMAQFNTAFEDKRPICGRLGATQLSFLFGDDAEHIGSAVMVPLSEAEPVGMLALGSHEQTRFHPGMGTLFLGYLGELVSRAVTRHLRNE